LVVDPHERTREDYETARDTFSVLDRGVHSALRPYRKMSQSAQLTSRQPYP